MEIILTIDRFEGDKAVLKTSDNNTIIWPKNKLPKQAKEGNVLSFLIFNSAEKENNKKNLAKNILNELLDVDED